jgi:CPA1 family monovalent cation:H+ antiporter
MSLFTVLSLVIALAAVFSFANFRFIRLPTTIGVTLIALCMSLSLIGADALGLPVHAMAVSLIARLNFREIVLDWMLAFLLFAGALNVDLEELAGQKLSVALLASVGVLASTFLVGGMTWALSRSLGLGISLVESLLFGALISPTDPIAVLGILRATSAPKALQAQMAGESLFNDGFAVVVFSVILGVAAATGTGTGTGTAGSGAGIDVGAIAFLFARQVLGSLLLGLVVGWLTYLMLRAVDNYQVEILLTLALAMGLYGLATALHTSGPLAVVVAGLLIGSKGRAHAMSPHTVEHLDMFWELVDEILNVVLFVLIGFEILVVPFTRSLLLMGVAAVALVLAARALSVGATVLALKRIRPFPPHAVKILTWGGLRGGLSLAMALSLGPQIASRHSIQAVTYVVAVFSIAVQGLTFGKLIRATRDAGAPEAGS